MSKYEAMMRRHFTKKILPISQALPRGYYKLITFLSVDMGSYHIDDQNFSKFFLFFFLFLKLQVTVLIISKFFSQDKDYQIHTR
jgi:hypothetical protein